MCFYVLMCKRLHLLMILLLSVKRLFNPTFERATLNLGIEKCCHLRENNSKPSLWSLDLQDHRQHSSCWVFLQVIDHLDIDKGKSHLLDVEIGVVLLICLKSLIKQIPKKPRTSRNVSLKMNLN